jgi:hypothetical protein
LVAQGQEFRAKEIGEYYEGKEDRLRKPSRPSSRTSTTINLISLEICALSPPTLKKQPRQSLTQSLPQFFGLAHSRSLPEFLQSIFFPSSISSKSRLAQDGLLSFFGSFGRGARAAAGAIFAAYRSDGTSTPSSRYLYSAHAFQHSVFLSPRPSPDSYAPQSEGKERSRAG